MTDRLTVKHEHKYIEDGKCGMCGAKPDWTNSSRWPEPHQITPPMEGLCLWPSRSDWPIFHYDGRWRCSQKDGHGGDHLATSEHKPDGAVVWEGPWVAEEAFSD